jgi:hypothetical protein
MNKESSTRVYHASPRHIVSLKEIIAQEMLIAIMKFAMTVFVKQL